MKGIWKQYGQTLLYVIAAAVLVTLGIWSAGRGTDQIGISDTDHGLEHAVSELSAFYEGQDPVITYRGDSLTVDSGQPLEECFQALDETGQELAPEICGIWDSNGYETEYPFRYPGIYCVKVRARDENRRTAAAEFYIPVNGGGA